MKDRISKAEIRKDALQDGVEATTAAVGAVTSIVVGAVGDVAKAVGGLATDLFEIRDAAKKASAEGRLSLAPELPGEVTAAELDRSAPE